MNLLNGNPRSENVLKVIRNLESVLPFAKEEKSLNFSVMEVDYEGAKSCGTPHCHAGWYSVAVKLHHTSFTAGGAYMAFHLGWNLINHSGSWSLSTPSYNATTLPTWAEKNPKIWGNDRGVYMFSAMGRCSFISPTRPHGASTLQDIVDHWKEVYERLVILEKGVEITDPPVYIENLIPEEVEV